MTSPHGCSGASLPRMYIKRCEVGRAGAVGAQQGPAGGVPAAVPTRSHPLILHRAATQRHALQRQSRNTAAMQHNTADRRRARRGICARRSETSENFRPHAHAPYPPLRVESPRRAAICSASRQSLTARNRLPPSPPVPLPSAAAAAVPCMVVLASCSRAFLQAMRSDARGSGLGRAAVAGTDRFGWAGD